MANFKLDWQCLRDAANNGIHGRGFMPGDIIEVVYVCDCDLINTRHVAELEELGGE